MKDIFLPSLLLLLLGTCGPARLSAQSSSAADETYIVNVHPGQELLTMIQIMAGKYRAPNKSTYQADFEAHFFRYKKHPAVKKLSKLPKRMYTDFPELGWTITGWPEPGLYLPEENMWYEDYGKEWVQDYLRLAVEFANDTDFWSFYQAHQGDYTRWALGVRKRVDSLGYARRLAEFYALGNTDTKQPTFYIALDPLNSWGAHAIPTLPEINPKYAGYRAYSLGYWNRESTKKEEPSFNGTGFLSKLVWHEGSHIYLNDLLAANAEAIASIAYLYNGDERKMKNQNIDDWSYCFEENLVRGVVIALTKRYRSHRAYREQNADELLSGFIYAEDIAEWIERVYLAPDNERSLGVLLPDLVMMLKDKYDAVPE